MANNLKKTIALISDGATMTTSTERSEAGMSNRESGFYWVKYYQETSWVIAEWRDGLKKWRCGNWFCKDADFAEIDERKLTRAE